VIAGGREVERKERVSSSSGKVLLLLEDAMRTKHRSTLVDLESGTQTLPGWRGRPLLKSSKWVHDEVPKGRGSRKDRGESFHRTDTFHLCSRWVRESRKNRKGSSNSNFGLGKNCCIEGEDRKGKKKRREVEADVQGDQSSVVGDRKGRREKERKGNGREICRNFRKLSD